MDKYLKMADVFDLPILGSRAEFFPLCLNESSAMIAAHAINSHDELVAEVERLRLMISECYPYIKDKADWGNEYEVDLADRLFDAAK